LSETESENAAPSADAEMEEFAVYGMSMGYPPVCRFEFNPKTRREKGDVVLHFPDKEKVFLSWGQLSLVLKKHDTAKAFADHSIKSMSKSRSVKKSEKLAEDSFKVNGHEAAYNKAKFEEVAAGGLFGRGRAVPGGRVTLSVHLFCPESSRYYVVYALLTPKAPEDFDELFVKMAKSFKCH
jgi:hypothetical protein